MKPHTYSPTLRHQRRNLFPTETSLSSMTHAATTERIIDETNNDSEWKQTHEIELSRGMRSFSSGPHLYITSTRRLYSTMK